MDDDIRCLDCPDCGESNQESDYEELHFNCGNCGISYDWMICQTCGEVIAEHQNSDGTCPICDRDMYGA